jgi:hypothetical protein
MIGNKIIVDAVVHPYDLDPAEVARRMAHDEISRARAQVVPPPWSALRRAALAPSA